MYIFIAITTAIGLILINGGSGDLGLLFLLPAIVPVVKRIVKKVGEGIDQWQAGADAAAAAEKARLAAEKQKKEALETQRNLVIRYRNSELTKEILEYICCVDGRRTSPESIEIYNDRVVGKTKNEIQEYNFTAHRVGRLNTVIEVAGNREAFNYLVKPQMALAQAINSLLANQYNICDNAKIDYKYKTDSYGDSRITYTYTSDHVTMERKDIKTRYF